MDCAPPQPSTDTLESRCYHFAAQNVLLTNIGPSHFGVAGPDRIYLAYELAGKLEIYRFVSDVSQRSKRYSENGEPDDDDVTTTTAKERPNEFVLERTIQLYDVDIVQLIHCQLMPEYFALLVHNRLTRLRSVRAYTNYMNSETKEPETSFKIRLNGELISTMSNSTPDTEVPPHLDHVDLVLNVIEFQHADISSLANYINCCPVSGNLVISIANGTTLLFRYTRCVLPANKHHIAIDFVLIKSITILDGWIPEQVKLSLNYIALMCSTHFSLLQIELNDEPDSYQNGRHQLEVGCDPKFATTDQCHLIYNRLFDEPEQDSIFSISKHRTDGGQSHADTVWGPVSDALSCKFAVYDHFPGNKTIGSRYHLLQCRRLALPKSRRTKSNSAGEMNRFATNELTTLRVKNKLCNDQQQAEYKLHLFGMDLQPFRDRNGLIFAHALYVFWSNQLTCYLIDLRRDNLRLVPISQLDLTIESNFQSNGQDHTLPSSTTTTAVIRDFNASPQEDLVHVLTDNSFDTYCSQLFPFLVSEAPENIYCSRPIAELYQVSSHVFFNLIASLSSPQFVFLLSAEESGRHTVYNLRRPSVDHLQADILSTIDDIKSNSDDSESPFDKHSLHRLYLQLLAIIRFVSLFPCGIHSNNGVGNCGSRLERLEEFHRKISAEMEEIIKQRPSCGYPNCPFAIKPVGDN